MPKGGWGLIYIDRAPSDPYKGWGWIEVHKDDDCKFNIPGGYYPESYKKAQEACRNNISERYKYAGDMNLPSRGRGGTNKFIVDIDGEQMTIRAQKSLTVKAVSAWVKTWPPPPPRSLPPANVPFP